LRHVLVDYLGNSQITHIIVGITPKKRPTQ